MSSSRPVRVLTPVLSCCAALAPAQESPPRLLIDPQGHPGSVWEMFFRASMDELITVGDKSIRFWDLGSGDLVRTLRGEIGEGPSGQLHAAALSRDERYLAVGGKDADNTIHIIDLETDRIAAALRVAHMHTAPAST
jgi:WD40 repeat protein